MSQAEDEEPREPENRKGRTMKRPFPWKLCLLNGLVIFVSFLLGAVVPTLLWILRESLSGFLMIFFMEAYIVALICGALMVLLLPYHAVVFFAFRRRIGNSVIWTALFLLPAILLVGAMVHGPVPPAVRARTILSRAELAPLPESARCVRLGCVSYVIGGKHLLKFHASREDIEQFLNASTSLQGHECEKFSAERMRLGRRGRERSAISESDGKNEYFSPDSSLPTWYKEEIRGQGRHFRRPGHAVEVIVDDEQNVVFVSVTHNSTM